MKKQVPLGYSHTYGYPSAPRTPMAHGGRGNDSAAGGASNLPSIFGNPGGAGLILPRPQSGLSLDVKGLNSTGLYLSNGPRERPEKPLSSSDSVADRIRRAQKYHALHTPRHHTSDGRSLHQRGSQPVESMLNDREKVIAGGAGGGAITSIVRRQPSATVDKPSMVWPRPGTLPPIGAESECETTEEGGDEESGLEEDRGGSSESTDDSELDTDDEV